MRRRVRRPRKGWRVFCGVGGPRLQVGSRPSNRSKNEGARNILWERRVTSPHEPVYGALLLDALWFSRPIAWQERDSWLEIAITFPIWSILMIPPRHYAWSRLWSSEWLPVTQVSSIFFEPSLEPSVENQWSGEIVVIINADAIQYTVNVYAFTKNVKKCKKGLQNNMQKRYKIFIKYNMYYETWRIEISLESRFL